MALIKTQNISVLIALGAFLGCTHYRGSKTEFFKAEPTRLLNENPLQGWKPTLLAPPRVGDYDETFMTESVFQEPRDDQPLKNCLTMEGEGESIQICRDQDAKRISEPDQNLPGSYRPFSM